MGNKFRFGLILLLVEMSLMVFVAEGKVSGGVCIEKGACCRRRSACCSGLCRRGTCSCSRLHGKCLTADDCCKSSEHSCVSGTCFSNVAGTANADEGPCAVDHDCSHLVYKDDSKMINSKGVCRSNICILLVEFSKVEQPVEPQPYPNTQIPCERAGTFDDACRTCCQRFDGDHTMVLDQDGTTNRHPVTLVPFKCTLQRDLICLCSIGY